jgi:ribonuclease P protein component
MVYPNDTVHSRFGVAASRALGTAVDRNRARRRLRAGLAPYLSQVKPGWDIILIARHALGKARFAEIQVALGLLFEQANLLQLNYELTKTTPPNSP